MQITLRDFTTFLQAVSEGRLLNQATRDLMLSPQIEIFSKHQFPSLSTQTTDENRAIRLSYGLGWCLYSSPYGKVFFKEGHDDGFRNYAVTFEKPGDGIVILTNSPNGEGIFKPLLEELCANTFTPIEWEGFTPYDKIPPRKPLRVHHEITLTSAALERLAGRYEVKGLAEVVKVSGGHLMLQESDEPPEEIFPESELSFFAKTNDDVITFDLDSRGKPTRFVVHTGGQNIPVARVQ